MSVYHGQQQTPHLTKKYSFNVNLLSHNIYVNIFKLLGGSDEIVLVWGFIIKNELKNRTPEIYKQSIQKNVSKSKELLSER